MENGIDSCAEKNIGENLKRFPYLNTTFKALQFYCEGCSTGCVARAFSARWLKARAAARILFSFFQTSRALLLAGSDLNLFFLDSKKCMLNFVLPNCLVDSCAAALKTSS